MQGLKYFHLFILHYSSASKDVHKNQSEAPELKDVKLSELKLKNNQVLNTLAYLVQEDEEVSATLNRLLADFGLKIPTSRPSSARSTASSVRSSHSAKSSASLKVQHLTIQ